MRQAPPEIRAALHLIDEGFDKPSWHGPNLLGSLRGMTLRELTFRPHADAHNAWELALHCAYWKYAIENRLMPGRRPPSGRPGDNFSRREHSATAADWKRDLALVKTCHAQLRATIAELRIPDLGLKLKANRHTYRRTIFGIAAHDIYHAGQISLLKKLARG